MLHQTRKEMLRIQSGKMLYPAVISAVLHESVVRIKHFHSVSHFLLYWMRIIFCIYKVFVRPLKALFATVPLLFMCV